MAAGPLRIERVDAGSRFATLRDDWNALLHGSAAASITLTWEWMFTWWEVFGEHRTLHILLAFEHDVLIGIAPLQRYAIRRFGIRWQRVALMGSGEPVADEICSDYL